MKNLAEDIYLIMLSKYNYDSCVADASTENLIRLGTERNWIYDRYKELKKHMSDEEAHKVAHIEWIEKYLNERYKYP